MTEEEFTTLLKDVENYIDFTWTDPGTEKKIREATESGIRFLKARANRELDFKTNDDGARYLLFKYVLYDFYGRDDFKEIYREDLINLSLERSE